MHPIRFQLGVSFLENGTKVLTPFARCGKVYAYNERAALTFDSIMVTVLWLGVLAAGNITAALWLEQVTAAQALALFPLAFILLDAIRIGALLWVFRRRPLHVHPLATARRSAAGEITPFGAMSLRRVMTALDALMLYGAVYNLALGLPTLGVAVILACAAHLGVYAAQMSAREAVSSRF
jgi:hypothetical protein